MRKIFLAIFIFCSVGCASKTQITSIDVLKNTISKISSLHNFSYKTESLQKNPFSENDTTFTKSCETIVQDNDGNVVAQNLLMNVNSSQIKSREIYFDKVLYSLNLNDSVYNISLKPKEISNYIESFTDLVKTAIHQYPSKIFMRNDTIINDHKCYNIFIKAYDNFKNNRHDYKYQQVYIDRLTLMPVCVMTTGAGNADKDGISLGRLNFFEKTYYSEYKLNGNVNRNTFLFNLKGFEQENKKMLTVGSLAPNLSLKDLNNRPILSKEFKDKILIVEFGSTTCGANPLANPMLNRLSQKFKPSVVNVIAIYSSETVEQVKNYIKANDLKFPIYLGEAKLKKQFKTTGTPNFYIINQTGKIVKSIDGYSDRLEREIIAEVEKLKN